MKLLPYPTLGGEQLIKNYLEIFLINLLREQTETVHGNATFLPWKELSAKPINDITALLKENVYSSLTIDDICKKLLIARRIYSVFLRRRREKRLWLTLSS